MPEPMYRMIAEELHAEIDNGFLVSGAQLPTEIELRERFGASRNTIRDALKLLISRGLVETRPGQGTFVAQRIDPIITTLSGYDTKTGDPSELDLYSTKMQSSGRHLKVSAPRVEIRIADSELAEQLGVAEGLPVISRHHELTIDGVPWSLQTTFYPLEFVNRGATRLIETANLEGGALAYLKDKIGVTQSHWRDLIIARAPNRAETVFFGLPDAGQVPVFEIQRTGFDETRHPMRLSITVYAADRNKFIYEEEHAAASLPNNRQRHKNRQ